MSIETNPTIAELAAQDEAIKAQASNTNDSTTDATTTPTLAPEPKKLDLRKYPFTPEAVRWLTAKAEGRGPLRLYIYCRKFGPIAVEMDRQITLAEAQLLVGEGEQVRCSLDHGAEPHLFTEVWVVAIQRDRDPNVEPIEGLPPEIAERVVRLKDGSQKVEGAHFEVVEERDEKGIPLKFRFDAYCGAPIFVDHRDDGSFGEYPNKRSHLGQAKIAAKEAAEPKTNPKTGEQYKLDAPTFDAVAVKEITERRANGKRKHEEWLKRQEGNGSALKARFAANVPKTPRGFRGDGAKADEPRAGKVLKQGRRRDF